MKETTLCYIEKDGKYLMLHRVKKQNDINKDKWIGIGGKLEEGETPDQCLLREAKEEMGLTLTSYRYRGIVYFSSDIYEDEEMHLYTADGFEGELAECDEGNLEWVDRTDLYNLTLWEGDKLFLSLLMADADFFNMTVQYKGDKLVSATVNGEKLF